MLKKGKTFQTKLKHRIKDIICQKLLLSFTVLIKCELYKNLRQHVWLRKWFKKVWGKMRIKITGRTITSLTFSSHFLSSLPFSAHSLLSASLPSLLLSFPLTLSLFLLFSQSRSPPSSHINFSPDSTAQQANRALLSSGFLWTSYSSSEIRALIFDSFQNLL